ncbi:MAG TPA: malectin domain-containing carbohydrate-binding protein, partial [Verrucomicrobiota bacterium]|nr:malectin domain-containing carbohydrate-binding protein [Verrucomicrobiota bacterium]
QHLAAREIRRYLYLRTGERWELSDTTPTDGPAIVVGAKNGSPAAPFLDPATTREAQALQPQQFLLKSIPHRDGPRVLVLGGDDLGTLYGAYRYAERLGARFYLHGDVLPDERLREWPIVHETGKPLFALRGVNPWGSHPFGFDAWGADDYKALFTQLAKLRMNFLGVHCYPEGLPYAEPTVWHGVGGDFDAAGRVRQSYVSRYFNTLLTPGWGDYRPKKTGDYSFGGAELFDDEAWAPEVLAGYCPLPATPEDCNDVFNRMAAQFRDAFTFARQLGVKTCVGTEAPLTLPKAVSERLRAAGQDPGSPAAKQTVYEGTFRRIMASHPLDYYWIWTPEGWTWEGNQPAQYSNTVADIQLALDALQRVNAPFQLATAGWVLGPVHDRAAFDRDLPKQVPMSAINRNTGATEVDPAFGRIVGRETWAIPWLESDNREGLAAVQLEAGRMRRDAVDALAYGCTGLMGLHWRTDMLSPNVAALAQAAWDQSWKQPAPVRRWTVPGQVAQYADAAIAGAADTPLYRTCRYDLGTILLTAPNGSYRVTLKFCEPHFKSAGERICDVRVQGATVLTNLDVFARVGAFAALDFTWPDVAVTNGTLTIELVPRKSLPCLSAVAVENPAFTAKINCGGPAYRDWEADTGPARGLPCDDFYTDWAQANFGLAEAGRVFAALDGRVPRVTDGGCPSGSLTPVKTPWNEVAPQFAFVDEIEQLRPRVRGAGNIERFDYWLSAFKYLRSLAQLRCALARPEPDELTRLFAEVYRHLLATVNTPGGLAMVVNLENHPGWGLAVAAQAKTPWPKTYAGEPRLIVPTVRSVVNLGESLTLKIIALDRQPVPSVRVQLRLLGRGTWRTVPAAHLVRGVWQARLPVATDDFEYYIEASTADAQTLRWPVTAPAMNQTVVARP